MVTKHPPGEAHALPVKVSVILPTLNEFACLTVLGPRLEAATADPSFEFIVVDDGSTDGTPEWVESQAKINPSWRLIRRPRPLGLASAVITGFQSAKGSTIVVMDADGSHPPELIRDLVTPVAGGSAEFALASRRLLGISRKSMSRWRELVSSIASLLARPLTSVSDPMSGYFALDAQVLERASLSPLGFKIGLEVIVCCRPNPIVEVGYSFESRIAGQSKLGHRQIFEYIRHLSRLYRREFLS